MGLPTLSGEKMPAKGSVTSYTRQAIHDRIRAARGPASAHQCVRCPDQAHDWAQIHTEDGRDIWADYVPMCRACHMAYDSDSRPWLYAPTAESEERRLAGLRASWTPDRRERHREETGRRNRARWQAMAPEQRVRAVSRPCQPGCTCGRHRSQRCLPGCGCRRHRSQP
jgi:hypothetical protein